jgi:beta-lactam-binding protein with PASTA domain/tRNA A-37 threonylcarbamoyl transferase component Bud32
MPGTASTELPGRVLSGRYLLHGAIGTGASGRVYVADDQRLRRRVAVKVLHAALADDAAFLRRFRAEAQLAGSLRHANIVTVYDWGEDEVPFMVLELLEGGSLRSMLDQGTQLTIAQAARVGRDVASALEYAHARDVLHRDVKPANLLFDEHGVVRVADFGLARALAEASWTEPAGGMLGTARYASPEQAMGVTLDARSDLYSLALVLVEAVTGRVPFASDTTIGMLTARTQRPLIAPDELGPLAAVIDRAGSISPEDRYPDAGTMRQALSDVADSLPPPGPLVLAGMVDHADPHPTRVATPVSPPLFDQDATEQLVAPVIRTTREKKRDRRRWRNGERPAGQRRFVPWVVGAALVAVIAIAASAFAGAGAGGASTISMPGFVGRPSKAAIALAESKGLTASVTNQAAPDPAGTVIDQSPAVGSWTSGTKVRLTVSSGPAPVAVPPVQGEPWANAKKQLDATGFFYGTPTQQYSDSVPTGNVIKTSPGGGVLVAPDGKVTVVLSKGRAPIDIPDVSGMTFANAVTALHDVHLRSKRGADTFSNTVPQGQVVQTLPASGQPAPYGSVVEIIVSHGPIMVVVPDVRNLTFSQASDRLAAKGIQFSVKGTVRAGEVVIDQTPKPRSRVPLEGTTVELTFGPQS